MGSALWTNTSGLGGAGHCGPVPEEEVVHQCLSCRQILTSVPTCLQLFLELEFWVWFSRFPCVLLALSWNTNENPSADKLSRAIN